MDAVELLAIKNYQRDFEKRFKKKLEIDWLTMKGAKMKLDDETKPSSEELLKQALVKYGASIDVIRSGKRLLNRLHRREHLAVEEYCKKIVAYQIDLKEAADLINRDRSLIYYYVKKV